MSDTEVTSESTVALPVGPLLDGIERRLDKRLDHQDQFLDRIDRRLEGMVTKEEFGQLTATVTHQGERLDGVEGRVDTLERKEVVIEHVGDHKRHAWSLAGWAVVAGAAVATAAGTLIAVFH